MNTGMLNSADVDCVLGSGPGAVSCAHALLQCGRRVILVDPGRRLPADRAALVDEFRGSGDRASFLERLRALRSGLPPEIRGRKLPFSSNYLYDRVEQYLPAQTDQSHVLLSLASGGLSAVWGATVMPLAEESFRHWPVTRQEMEPFYRKVAGLIDVPAVWDDLAELYPNYGEASPTALSEQGAQLIANLCRNRNRLAAAGIAFGRCRSAIGSMYAKDASGCVYCGLCMYGCPYHAIFSAEYVVDGLKSNPQLSHCTGRIAVGFEEKGSGVEVRLRRLDGGADEILSCQRLFVACGAPTSLRLVVAALKMFEQDFYLKDTQLVSIPLFLMRRCRPEAIPRANALGQIFLILNDTELCDQRVHLQVYGFNPFITDLLRARWGGLVREGLLQPLLNQMMVVMAYLPGQLSGRIAVKVAPSASDAGLPPARFSGEANPRTKRAARQIGHKLRAHRGELGAWPALPLMQVPDPGFSNHLGACLPMRQTPRPGETDRLGRPYGLQRVHVVDSACFSDLPSEHLTYTIMANAMRIATEATAKGLS